MTLPISNDVLEWSVDRGRQNELNRTEGGTARLLLRNRDAKYDVTNPGSPYAGQIDPFKQVAINPPHPVTGDFVPIFHGYAEAWNYLRRGPRDATVELQCIDGFELLNNAQVVPNAAQTGGAAFYAAQHVDDRIKALLQDAGWPAARTSIYSGNVNVQDTKYLPGTSFLTAILDAADAEFPGVANCYIAKDGKFNFRGRYDRFNYADYPRGQWYVGDSDAVELDDTLVPMFDMTWNYDKANLYNTSLVTPHLVADLDIPGQRVNDATSIGKYGERALDIQDIIVLDNPDDVQTALQECKRYAQYFVNNYKVPHVRIDSIEFHGQMAEDDPDKAFIWDFIMGVEIGDIVWVTTHNPGAGGFNAKGFFVEGIHHHVTNLNDKYPNWTLNLDLSPLDLFNQFPGPF